MSAAAICFGSEIGKPELGLAPLEHSAAREHTDVLMAPGDAPHGSDAAGLCCETACEADLVSAAKAGDHNAFVELCRRHIPSLKRRIVRIIRNREDAEDLLQDTLIRAFSNLLGFRGQCSFRTWIMTIAINNSLMLLRKRRRHPETGFGLITSDGTEFEALQVSDPMPDPEQCYARRQATIRVSQAVKMLPAGSRLLVERFHRDEIKLADAANAIGITEAAAKSRLMRARKMLRRTLTNPKITTVCDSEAIARCERPALCCYGHCIPCGGK